MLRRVSVCHACLVRSTASRSRSAFARGAVGNVQPKIAREAQPIAAISERAGSKEEAFVAWQRRLMPQLAELDFQGLRNAMLEAEKRLPLLPEKEFLDAWLEATKPVMTQVPMATWEVAQKLGAWPNKEFMFEFGLAAQDMQQRRHDILLFTLVDVMLRWGGTLETMGPFLAQMEKTASNRIRGPDSRGLYTGVMVRFSGAGYTPSREFVRQWVGNAMFNLADLMHHDRDATAVWDFMSTVATVPTDDMTLVWPLMEKWAQEKPRFEGLTDRKLITTLFDLVDCWFEPPADWIKELSTEMIKRLAGASERSGSSMMRALSALATPKRDFEAAESFAKVWAAATLTSMSKWPSHALIESLAALFRLRIGPGVIGEQWFQAWLESAHGLVGRKGKEKERDGQNVLISCRQVAFDLAGPRPWDGTQMPVAGKVSRLMRQLQDVQALDLNDGRVIGMWLDRAMVVDGFRRHHVQRAARYLRDLGSREAAQLWERHNAKKERMVR